METLGPFEVSKGYIYIYRVIYGLYRDNGKENGNPRFFQRDTYIYIYTGLYMVYIGRMEKKMETLGPFKGICRVIWGLCRDNGKIGN